MVLGCPGTCYLDQAGLETQKIQLTLPQGMSHDNSVKEMQFKVTFLGHTAISIIHEIMCYDIISHTLDTIKSTV